MKSVRDGQVRGGAVPAVVCEQPLRRCGATAVLLAGGPVRVPFRACCAAALVPGLRVVSTEKET